MVKPAHRSQRRQVLPRSLMCKAERLLACRYSRHTSWQRRQAMCNLSVACQARKIMMNDTERMASKLKQLYEQQVEKRYERYIDLHSRNKFVIRRHVEAFRLYRPYISGGKVLDWGCRHAVDSCLLRSAFGERVDLYGCDVGNLSYDAFFDFAQLKYSALDHPFHLPYADGEFDAVIASGVLEHVPNDAESLKEIYRVLKPSGVFVITFLPNAYSWTEFLSRNVLRRNYHLRTYSLGGIRSRLLHSGFKVKRLGYHQFLPSLSSGNLNAGIAVRFVELVHPLDRLLSHVPGIRALSANLVAVSHKVTCM